MKIEMTTNAKRIKQPKMIYLPFTEEAENITTAVRQFSPEDFKAAYNWAYDEVYNFDINVILSAMQRFARERNDDRKTYRRRFIVRLGQKIIPIETSDIAYFYVEGKSKYIVKNDGTRYFFDQQMESILDDLDPQVFFRISRNFIISSYAIHGIERIYGGRLKILMTPPPETDMIVARSRVSDFMAWLA